ncbi:tripartite ATP-independent transporter DctP family solute receptor [Loktanella sp. PT4BL]|jgi:tripartite ATP-independent transporter DctP family solute receptor|uniref:sialic acid TRAP transporter substrate-binding protein SiaP n=1 Tax=Loktanella sp. PT4BL TaxID=2135611 RepID=UPI000D772697|nr:sialic acid TRAP transporter substrate-binding protein SiaP [Loktanella sp. PT4BL]PXW65551.1 tripartite ATP-independent transporter DctP family solute receptor [Loktanella sp. PT4BL]
MTKFFNVRVMLASGVLAIASASYAQAQVELKWGHVYESQSPYHAWAEKAASTFEERTDGRYSIEVFPASSLGKQTDLAEGLSLGAVDIIYDGQFFAGRRYGPIAIGSAPFMFRDYDHWQAYRDSDLFADLSAGYTEATGDDIAGLVYYGERHVTSNIEITVPEDMAGMKIRVPNASLYKMFPEAVGANATPMAFSEVYLALQQGVVDAQENPLPTIQFKKFYEVQDYITLTGHITDALLTIVAGRLSDDMSEKDYAILMEVLAEAANGASEDIRTSELELVDWLREQGATVNEVDRAPFREAVAERLNGSDATWDRETFDRLQSLN